MDVTNPFYKPFRAPHEALPFDQFKLEHFAPAIERGLELAKGRLDVLRKDASPATFENSLLVLETCDEEASIAAEAFFNLLSAHAVEGMHALAAELSPKLADFSSDIYLDSAIFARIREVHDKRHSLGLNAEQLRLVERTFLRFRRNGALLDETAKARLRAIDQELASLGPAYSENILKATNAFELHVTDAARLEGLPESVRESTAEAARKKGKDGWLFGLQIPVYMAVMTHARDRELREQISRAYASRAFGGEFDNQVNVLGIARLRLERARLLGYATHADYVLEDRMAEKPERVSKFLERLIAACRPAAERDVAKVAEFKAAKTGDGTLKAWDFLFWSERLKEEKYSLNEEELRPYFKLENVIEGVFEHARRLYGLSFLQVRDVPVYHPDVRVYEVSDEATGNFVGLFYADFFPRPEKRNGAWMTAYREQGYFGGRVRRPHIGIVCNFTKPTESKPSLLTLDEVETLFHEFGHALHGLLSDCTYRSLAGTNVSWDFVELPSQIMENWVQEKEALDLYARHYETGAPIPVELTEKIKASANYLAGYSGLRQLTFASLDMAWHGTDVSAVKDVPAFEDEAIARFRVLEKVPGTNQSCGFSHIFDGGYSAGYYSYKWAEVLDADAFEFFREKGLFSREVAERFRDHILSRGGTEPPMDLYKKFRGREPDPDALLRRDGLLG